MMNSSKEIRLEELFLLTYRLLFIEYLLSFSVHGIKYCVV